MLLQLLLVLMLVLIVLLLDLLKVLGVRVVIWCLVLAVGAPLVLVWVVLIGMVGPDKVVAVGRKCVLLPEIVVFRSLGFPVEKVIGHNGISREMSWAGNFLKRNFCELEKSSVELTVYFQTFSISMMGTSSPSAGTFSGMAAMAMLCPPAMATPPNPASPLDIGRLTAIPW